MLYAHIFHAPAHTGKKWQLILTRTASPATQEGKPEYSDDKNELKRKAEAAGAKNLAEHLEPMTARHYNRKAQMHEYSAEEVRRAMHDHLPE